MTPTKQTHTPKHSPAPWRRIKNGLYYIGDTDFQGTEYFKVCGFNKSEDCEFVLNIVNNYPALVEALRELVDTINMRQIKGFKPTTIIKAEQALKQIGE